MNFGQAITVANAALRNHADINKPYTDEDVKEAVRFALGEFVRRSRCTHAVMGLTVTTGTNVVTISSGNDPDGKFSSARMLRDVAYTTTFEELKFVSFNTLSRMIRDAPDTTGQPEYAAWRTFNIGNTWPKADSTYIYTADYYDVLDTLEDVADEINISDHYIRPALWWGVPAALRYAGREDIVASPMWGEFMRYCQQVYGERMLDVPGIVANEDDYL